MNASRSILRTVIASGMLLTAPASMRAEQGVFGSCIMSWRSLHVRRTVSLPFEPGDHKRVVVKTNDGRRIESLKIVEINR